MTGDADLSKDTVRLLMKAINAGDWDLCKELARFLTSFDSILFSHFTANARHGEHIASSFDACWPPGSIIDTSIYESSDVRLHVNYRASSYKLAFSLGMTPEYYT